MHMKLYLMRHGQAAAPQVDPQQGLTAEGRTEIERLANTLAQRNINISVALHSEKARAQQTAEIMTAILAPTVTPLLHANLKPNDDPRLLLAEIDSWQSDTLITSHLPFIPSLLDELTDHTGASRTISFAPGTIVCLQRDEDSNWLVEWTASP